MAFEAWIRRFQIEISSTLLTSGKFVVGGQPYAFMLSHSIPGHRYSSDSCTFIRSLRFHERINQPPSLRRLIEGRSIGWSVILAIYIDQSTLVPLRCLARRASMPGNASCAVHPFVTHKSQSPCSKHRHTDCQSLPTVLAHHHQSYV